MIESISECALCRVIISQIDKLLGDSKVDAEIEEVVKKVCKYLSANKQNEVIFYFMNFFNEKLNFKLKFKTCAVQQDGGHLWTKHNKYAER